MSLDVELVLVGSNEILIPSPDDISVTLLETGSGDFLANCFLVNSLPIIFDLNVVIVFLGFGGSVVSLVSSSLESVVNEELL
jgi:hypothetical protein